MEEIDWLYLTNFRPLSTLLKIPKYFKIMRKKQDDMIKIKVG